MKCKTPKCCAHNCCLDPEVQTLTSLTNVQNSLFVPDLGKYVNRRPTYSLTSLLKDVGQKLKPVEKEGQQPPVIARPAPTRRADTSATINSRLSDSRYAVLPEGASLSGWTYEDRVELNDHVRHMLHSRRSKFKRAMKGFGQYVRRRESRKFKINRQLITSNSQLWVSSLPSMLC